MVWCQVKKLCSSTLIPNRFGAISAGWLGLLKHYHLYIPTTIYGVLAIVFATMSMALPETKDEKIPDTLEEGEQGCSQSISLIQDWPKKGPQVARIGQRW